MSDRQALLSELEEAVASGSKDRRIETMRRVTDLFLGAHDKLNDEQIGVFDDVLGYLIKRVEECALEELSARMAPIDNAPIGLIRNLAGNDQIAIAGPVLTHSRRLSDSDLAEIAKTRGQGHLMAISARSELGAVVTDILIERGDFNVHRKLASSPGARFSDAGYQSLVRHSESDNKLSESLGLRLDIPINYLKQLLEKASQVVRERLLAHASESQREAISSILRTVGLQTLSELPSAPDFDRAARTIKEVNAQGQLNEAMILDFARHRNYAEVVVAIATMCYAPPELIDKILSSPRQDAVIVLCRAAGFSWPSLRPLTSIFKSQAPSERQLDQLKEDFGRLSRQTAQRVMRFWCAQHIAGKDLSLSQPANTF